MQNRIHGKNYIKRFGALVLAASLLLTSASCGKKDPEPEPVLGAPADGGTMLCLSSSYNLTPDDVKSLIGVRPETLLFASTTAVAVNCMLEGNADSLLTLLPVSEFYASRNDGFVSRPLGTSVDLSMLVSSEQPDLIPLLNGAIASLQENGLIDALYDTWVTGYTAQNRPEEAEDQPVIPSFAVTSAGEPAPTLRIGISGVLPFFDYNLDDGSPCGFTAAFFAALAEKLEANLVFIPILPESKISALLDDKIDVYYWHFLDVPQICLATDPFITMELSLLEQTEPAEEAK